MNMKVLERFDRVNKVLNRIGWSIEYVDGLVNLPKRGEHIRVGLIVGKCVLVTRKVLVIKTF